eukprot:PhM_4_TR11261/c3_g1_i1/m.12228/K00815/TAT; tyrosine aminotransferase
MAYVREIVHWTPLPPSRSADNTFDPIEDIVDRSTAEPNPALRPLKLSLGDPTRCGNFPPPAAARGEALPQCSVKDLHGYGSPMGHPDALKALSEKFSYPDCKLDPNTDISLGWGCSGALSLCIQALCNPFENILLPTPAYSVYQTRCENMNVEWRGYNCLPEKDWEIDLDDLESKIDVRTRAILLCNPSNPCGSVFSRKHLQDIVALADKHRVPIISDEIYANMTFGEPFVSVAEVCGNVPVLVCGGLAKQYVVPGWRVGWVLMYDHCGVASDVRLGIEKLTLLDLGPHTVAQQCVITFLKHTPQSYYDKYVSMLKSGAEIAYSMLCDVPGLTPIKPSGGMFVFAKIDTDAFVPELFQKEANETGSALTPDVLFGRRLWAEKSLLLMPGICFRFPGYVRVCFATKQDWIREGVTRLQSFCQDHLKK